MPQSRPCPRTWRRYREREGGALLDGGIGRCLHDIQRRRDEGHSQDERSPVLSTCRMRLQFINCSNNLVGFSKPEPKKWAILHARYVIRGGIALNQPNRQNTVIFPFNLLGRRGALPAVNEMPKRLNCAVPRDFVALFRQCFAWRNL